MGEAGRSWKRWEQLKKGDTRAGRGNDGHGRDGMGQENDGNREGWRGTGADMVNNGKGKDGNGQEKGSGRDRDGMGIGHDRAGWKKKVGMGQIRRCDRRIAGPGREGDRQDGDWKQREGTEAGWEGISTRLGLVRLVWDGDKRE